MTIHPSSAQIVREVAKDSFSPEPPDLFGRIAARRLAGERVILPVSQSTRTQTSGVRKRWIITLLIGIAGASAAMPGSPIRRLIVEALTRDVAVQGRPGAAPNSALAPAAKVVPAVDSQLAGVSIPSRGLALHVNLDSLAVPVRVVLHLTDRNELEVRGVNAAATATFRPRGDGIGVSMLRRGSELRIDIPRAAPSFSLMVNGIELATVAGGQFPSSPKADSLVLTARP